MIALFCDSNPSQFGGDKKGNINKGNDSITSVHTENLIVNHHAQGKKVKHVGEIVPDVSVPILS